MCFLADVFAKGNAVDSCLSSLPTFCRSVDCEFWEQRFIATLQKRPPSNTRKFVKHVASRRTPASDCRTPKRTQPLNAKIRPGISRDVSEAPRSTLFGMHRIFTVSYKKYYVIFYILNCVNCIQAITSYNFAIVCIGYLLPAQQREQFFCCLTHILWIKSHKEHKWQFTQC